jgi:triphosphoribosyl-dephospho-CoA synthase
MTSEIAAAFEHACLTELQALKPGNVHVFADGHGMVVDDFVKSAHAASAVIAQPGLAVGQRILNAIEATWSAVGCNTNLGIVLLAAPLIQAAEQQVPVKLVLDHLTIEDAEFAFRAILKASPAGLGDSPQHDVHNKPSGTLLQAMQAAASRDFIAYQYASGFADICGFGLQRYREAMARWDSETWAATAVYLGWLARQSDTHVMRKYGDAFAEALRVEATVHERQFMACANPKNYMGELLRWDARLKRDGINPGTSADLTVATLFLTSDAMKLSLPPNFGYQDSLR